MGFSLRTLRVRKDFLLEKNDKCEIDLVVLGVGGKIKVLVPMKDEDRRRLVAEEAITPARISVDCFKIERDERVNKEKKSEKLHPLFFSVCSFDNVKGKWVWVSALNPRHRLKKCWRLLHVYR